MNLPQPWIDKYLLSNDLSTYDPYDIWTTNIGLAAKKFYNAHPKAGIPAAAALQLWDLFPNNSLRLGYQKKETPIVRAFATQALLELYLIRPENRYLEAARSHLEWLKKNCSKCQHGIGWGINFEHAVSPHVVYPPFTPFATITPYILEGFCRYRTISGDQTFNPIIEKILPFFKNDLQVIKENEQLKIYSYGPFNDRVVINANSYVMYSLSLFLESAPELGGDIGKIYNFVAGRQHDNGSWFYSVDQNSFIDCFHSCITLKNLIKTGQRIKLPSLNHVVGKGWDFLKKNCYDSGAKLATRFAVSNKPGIAKYDLYDNAEMLNLALLMDDHDFAQELHHSIQRHFIHNNTIYSMKDIFGFRHNKEMYRWAIMPYVYALAKMERFKHGTEN